MRFLLPHEWYKLAPVFEDQGVPMPLYTGLPCLVEEDKGEIIACLLLHQALPQLELWVHPEHREKGLARELAEKMKPELEDSFPYLAFAVNEQTEHLCKELGMRELRGKMFVMGVD